LLIASKDVVLVFGASSRVGEGGAFRVFLNQTLVERRCGKEEKDGLKFEASFVWRLHKVVNKTEKRIVSYRLTYHINLLQ
jgi:hypothetical protein